jgi:hypothetical protein
MTLGGDMFGIVSGVYKPLRDVMGHALALELAHRVEKDLLIARSADYTTHMGSFRARIVDDRARLTWLDTVPAVA